MAALSEHVEGSQEPVPPGATGANAGVRDAIEDLKHRIEDERTPTEAAAAPARRRARRRTLIVGVALVAAAAVGLAVSAVGKSPSHTTLASYLNGHVPSGTRIGVAPGVSGVPSAYETVPIGSAEALIAAQPHWMVVSEPPGADSATAWTVEHGTLTVSTPQGRLYAVSPPKPTPAPPPTPSHTTPTPPSSAPPPAATQPVVGMVTVQAGQSFWSIAESVVAQRTGAAPTAAQVYPLWQQLVVANANRLQHPGNPNLVYPGQVFLIPPP